MLAMTRTRTLISAALSALIVTAVAVVVAAYPASASATKTVRFDVGGQTCYQAGCAVNSASVPWGTYVTVSAGWAEIKAIGAGTVICRITDNQGHVLSEDTETVNGQWAFCHFTA